MSSPAQRLVKSKSMTTEEIGLNHALEHEGITPVETDLGEFIIQLAGETPSHFLAPAIHWSFYTPVAALQSVSVHLFGGAATGRAYAVIALALPGIGAGRCAW